MEKKSIIAVFILTLLLLPVLGSVGGASTPQLSLVITSCVKSLPADGKQHQAFFISVVDAKGRPYVLDDSINITVSSSDERVLKVPSFVIIGAKEYYVVVKASSSILEKKTAEVSVSSSGFQSAKATITVEPPAGTPVSLKLTLLPSVLAPSVGAEADGIVTIVDSYGKPAKARSNIDIVLSSSTPYIADATQGTVSIAKGEFSASFKLKTTGFIGTTTITASSSDLKSDSLKFTVAGSKPENLYIWLPSYINVKESGYVPVMVTDKDFKPAKVPTPLKVNLFSSNSSIVSVQSSVTIDVEKWYALATLKTTNLTGTVTIYASAENMTTASTKITVVESERKPVSLKIYSLAKNFPADELNYQGLLVQVLNDKGIPCKVNKSTVVNLFSSSSEILGAPSTITIPANSSMAYTTVVPRLPGSSKVTVVASNFTGTEAAFSVYEPTPASLNLIMPPIPAGGEVLSACLILSSTGVPAPVQEDTFIALTSSNTKIAEVESSTFIARKGYYSLFKVTGKTPGTSSLSASGSGLPSGSASVVVHEVRPSTLFVSSIKPLAGTELPISIQIISSAGPPAVLADPLTLSISSSNTSSFQVPSSAFLKAEDNEVLVLGDVLSTSKVTVTVSAEGFTSSTLQLTPTSYKASLKLTAEKISVVDRDIQVSAVLSVEGRPAVGVEVIWNGVGLRSTSTVTLPDGTCVNSLKVQRGENLIEASAIVPGAGLVVNTTKVQGLKEYTLDASSNVGAAIDVSPSGLKYREFTKVTLTAPSPVNMEGILGALGGKYNFVEWTGVVNSKSNPIEIEFKGEASRLSMKAVYTEDLTMVIIWLIIIAVIVIVVSLIVFKRYRSYKKAKAQVEGEAPKEEGEGKEEGKAETPQEPKAKAEQEPVKEEAEKPVKAEQEPVQEPVEEPKQEEKPVSEPSEEKEE